MIIPMETAAETAIRTAASKTARSASAAAAFLRFLPPPCRFFFAALAVLGRETVFAAIFFPVTGTLFYRHGDAKTAQDGTKETAIPSVIIEQK